MRKPRITQEGATYHVVARANRREFILAEKAMKQVFVDTVSRARKKYRFAVTNICLMNNHFHLMITPAKGESISRVMQWILSVFARRFNLHHGYQGHVWYDRFKSKPIAGLRQFVATFAYICDNPVKAGMVERALEYAYGGCVLLRAGPERIVDPPAALVRLLFPSFAHRQIAAPRGVKVT